ncbi:MGT family glycosyltransferase [Conyzicola lurida]|uniref:MGT family glycosyltransferase n=1 Tax=Conyzicola lurida TaxID=1172621 RepID=A0A841AIP4_9MICO|nr:nucleotide disphospho-sugar-binding domain-containing protein [Conyzicola lurida]MBB5841862.1 MGT family glycosyltransferase [Conyzicola lurida]
MSAILIASTPVHGHVTPLLAVARFLVARGHRVRFLTGARYRDAVVATGAHYLPLPADADYDDSDVNAAFPGRVGLSGVAGIRYDIAQIFLRPMPAQLRAIDTALEAEPADAVLTESMFLGAVALLTRPRSERPAVVNLGIVPLGISSRDTAPFGLGIPPLAGPAGRVRNALLSLASRRFIFGGVQREAERLVAESTGARLDAFFMDAAALADAVVQFSVPGFEYPRSDLPDRVHFVGPVSRSATSDAPLPEWWGDLDGSRAVVHVTQGTVANADYAELIAPAVAGLADDDVLVVVSTGGRPVSTLGALPANVRAAEYLPYDALLPLTDVYVSNGGYGGVHAAMRHGVPLVVAGQTEDKVEVTARVAWSGVGINLRTNRPTAAAVRDAVRTVLGSSRYREASARIGAEIDASSGLPGLEAVVVAAAGANEKVSP